VAINHLLLVTKLLIDKVNELTVEVNKMVMKVNNFEDKHDDLQQRSMKGNLIVGSPEINGKASLAHKAVRTDQQGGLQGVETSPSPPSCHRPSSDSAGSPPDQMPPQQWAIIVNNLQKS
jgi:hypothetical protein